MGQRVRAWLAVGVVVVGLGIVPVALRRDSFPVSDYPMFADDVGRAGWIPTAVAVDGAGAVVRLDPRLIGDTDEPMLAMVTVREAIEHGRADALCADIAARVGGRVEQAVRVEVALERTDALDWFADRAVPAERLAAATCAVPR